MNYSGNKYTIKNTMANLQDKLGKDLAQAQTAIMNARAYNVANSSQPWRLQIEWGIAVWSQGTIWKQKLPETNNQTSTVSESQWLLNPYNYVAPTSVSTPESTTNMSIADTFSWITRKKNTNIAETIKQVAPVWMQIESPVIPENKLQSFKDATQWQDVQFRQSYRQAMKTPNPIDSSGLSGAELQAYNMLNPQEQAQYKALATQWMKAQTDYLTKSKANIEYQKSQEEQRLAMEDNADAIADIMSQKNIEESQKQVANLKQNIWYLGSGWQPWVSSQKLDAISNQVTLADRTLKNIIEVERLQKANRELWQEKNAEIFTRQIKILQDDLDSKVNKTVQWALNQFNSAELEGKLDTIPEIEAFQQQLYAQLDWDLSSIMDTNIEARQFLIERYDKLAESQKAQMQANEKAKADYQKNSNTLNKDMSEALGYYVNNNWEALIDQKTGARIEVPLNTEKVFDQDTGNLMLFTTNKDGTITARMRKVWLGKPVTPEWKQTENGNWYNANSTTNPQFQSIDRQSAIWKYWSTPAVRNFNPWNIMDTWFGWQKVEWERFTVFSSPQEWFNALVAKIQNIQNWWSKVYSPDMTLLQYIGKYAPSSDNNNPQGYANAIANNLGISINTKIWQIDPVKLAEEHARHEDGNSYRMLKDIWIIWWWETQNTDQKAEAMALVQWLGWTEWERASYAKNIMDRANKKWISLIDAKKDLWYKTLDDKDFSQSRKEQYTDMKKWYSESTNNAKTALTLLNEPQTAIGDVASVVWFLKTIDPASVARESEVASVENARGIIDWLSNVFAKAKEGTKLTPTQRDQLKWAIQTIVNAQDKKFLETVYDMKKEFDTRWLDATVYIPKTYIDKAQKEYWKAEEAQKATGAKSKWDIMMRLQERIDSGIQQLMSKK